jgi:hypothetical protein
MSGDMEKGNTRGPEKRMGMRLAVPDSLGLDCTPYDRIADGFISSCPIAPGKGHSEDRESLDKSEQNSLKWRRG